MDDRIAREETDAPIVILGEAVSRWHFAADVQPGRLPRARHAIGRCRLRFVALDVVLALPFRHIKRRIGFGDEILAVAGVIVRQ
jgi:hypothetical protein